MRSVQNTARAYRPLSLARHLRYLAVERTLNVLHEVVNMSITEEIRGLCPVCIYGCDCVLAMNAKHPALQCAQFEGYPSVSREPVKRKNPHEARESNKRRKNSYRGLCSICDIAKTCLFPKPPGGVWQCEEYE